MPKHNQSARLGDLTDFAAVPPSDPDARTTALERRVTTLEALLNDVMQQLDRPFRDQHSKQNGTPKQAKTEAHTTEASSITRRSATPHQRGTEAGRQGSRPQVPEATR